MMGNQWVLGLHLFLLSIFLVATKYSCLGAQNSTVSCHERERLALLKFKLSVKDDFKVLSSWVGIDCCSWKGVHCDETTRSVVSLNLRGNYLQTLHVPYEHNKYYLQGDPKMKAYLAELRHLKHLDLSENDFNYESQIPESIGSLKDLHYLNLSYAGFSGIIPYEIGNLSNLKVLDLCSVYNVNTFMSNDMSWVSGLSSLEHLDLSGVDLLQANNVDMVFYMIPSLTYLSLRKCGLSNVDLGLHLNSSKILPNIKHLDLSYNYFKGQLPHFFRNLTSLKSLDLSSFNLSLAWNSLNLLNKIPSLLELHLSSCGLHNAHFSPTYFNLSGHSNIQELYLQSNSVEGRFPSVLANMTSLRVLDLSSNSLNSLIPVMPNLLKLEVSSNNFEHIELVGIWRQCYLKELGISNNYFGEEMIRPSINMSECSQYALELLDSSDNQLNGSIPESLGRLTNLRALQLYRNSLSGSIPKPLERLRSLEILDLSYNYLTGPILTLGTLTGLTYLDLRSNRLTGPVPISVGKLIKLYYLDVSRNSLGGVVSEAHFANLLMLRVVDITSNHKLIFNISNEWIPPFQLISLHLSSCKIANGFPKWLQTQMRLRALILSNASLHGILPTWLKKMPVISYLDLSYNKLSGSLISHPLTEYLLLRDNLFNGTIPRSMCTRTHLRVLDLSINELSGNIPDCVGNLQNLKTLVLDSNGLSGVLPNSLGHIFSPLNVLKLNDNNFNGELPPDLKNLGSLVVFDLGNNKFSGNLPKWIGENLDFLSALRLHKNNFTGRIPQSLCKCSYLQILDVAHNSLTGSIPHCFGELSGMVTVNSFLTESDETLRLYDIIVMDVIQVMKGMELEYTKTLDLVVNMDISSNKLTGEIPPGITSLILLVGLNLSHNHLSGKIPYHIGNMKALNSLDFSDNQLSGTIPQSMADLNFLSCLNLSYNNLSGRIPAGNQLQTFNDPSIYAGNRDLCGTPLLDNCSNHENPPSTISVNKYKDADAPKKVWFYVDIMCGFATGFWGIIGVLLFKKQWRHKLFMIGEIIMDKAYVAIAVRVSKIKRAREECTT